MAKRETRRTLPAPRKSTSSSASARRGQPAATSAPGDLDLLRALSNAVGVSGDEGAVRRLVLEAIRPHADEVRVDALGNVLAVRHAAKARRRQAAVAPARLMIAAHMDEVGLMIVDHDSDGSLRFEIVGGVNERTLLGQPVVVGPQRLPGVIGAAPVHLLSEERRNSVVKASQMRIDIGAGNQETARQHVQVGDRATFATEFTALETATPGAALRGKALDDRLGCATLIELLRGGPYPVELQAAFTVQEEVGLRGAQVAGYALEPDAAIALDCTPAVDLPDSRGEENTRYNARLGAGPVLYVIDNRTISDPRLVRYLRQTAEAGGLPYQVRQAGGGGTDAGAIQRARTGVPVVSVSVPGRYLHTPAALVRAEDWHNTLRLLQAALEGWSPRVLDV